MNTETKSTIEVFIREIQVCPDIETVQRILNMWIKDYNLHPENVKMCGFFAELERRQNKGDSK